MSRRVTVRHCANSAQADAIRIRLEAEGIHAIVQGGEIGTMLSYIGPAVGYPYVDVPAEDYDEAVAILEADEIALATAQPWICSRCDEPNEAAFDFCWSCNKSRDGTDRVAQSPDPSDPEPSDPQPTAALTAPKHAGRCGDAANPYRPVDWPAEPGGAGGEDRLQPVAVANHQTRRAYRAAVLGFLCPYTFLTLYSTYLLLSHSSERQGGTSSNVAQWYIAWGLNSAIYLALVIWLALYAVR